MYGLNQLSTSLANVTVKNIGDLKRLRGQTRVLVFYYENSHPTCYYLFYLLVYSSSGEHNLHLKFGCSLEGLQQ